MIGTDHDEIDTIVEGILQDGPEYFNYVNVIGRHNLEITLRDWSPTGRQVSILVEPSYIVETDPENDHSRYKDNIHRTDLRYFVIGIISQFGWLPYPGDGSGDRFIKYYQ